MSEINLGEITIGNNEINAGSLNIPLIKGDRGDMGVQGVPGIRRRKRIPWR